MGKNIKYSDANEKYTKAVILYSHSDNKLYEDEAHKIAVGRKDLLNLCLKNMLLIYHTDKSYYTVSAFKDDGSKVTVTVNPGSAAVTLQSTGE